MKRKLKWQKAMKSKMTLKEMKPVWSYKNILEDTRLEN